LVGKRISCSKDDLHELYQYTNRDEGLLFATSQLANQAGVSGVANLLFGQGGRDGQDKVPLLLSGGDRVMFSMGTGHCDITKRAGQIVVSNEQQFDGSVMAFSVNGGDGMKPLSDFGITHIGIRISVRLRRVGDSIALELHESTLRITTG
jgi:hypothetical protein